MSEIPLLRPIIIAGVLAVGAVEAFTLWLAMHPNVDEGYRAYYIDQTTTCLDKPLKGSYELGATVAFLPENWRGAGKVQICGWDGPAGDGAHSVGTSSRLRFPVGKPESPLVLRLYLAAIDLPGTGEQHVTVTSGNGLSLGAVTLQPGESRTVDFSVPPEAVEAGKGLDVVLAYPNAIRAMPHDSDTHLRAIKVVAVQLRRPGDLPSTGPLDDPIARQYEPGPGIRKTL